MLRMSQEKLAAELELSFQQVQKYERAANRIGASRLYQLCRVLQVPISFFFEGIDVEIREVNAFASRKPTQSATEQDPLRQPDAIELVEAYYRFSSPRLRARFRDFVGALADNGANSKRRGRRSTSRAMRTPIKD